MKCDSSVDTTGPGTWGRPAILSMVGSAPYWLSQGQTRLVQEQRNLGPGRALPPGCSCLPSSPNI